ncbi:MAG TPA: pyridoxamine 5'-phosphate oxidase family protein [Acidobacteriaceae bacterium]|jgi:general stress protein 26|nr:pyridoxamine 5'-phosphate oxidase family protein [Acidobacteriaceae bacterium]
MSEKKHPHAKDYKELTGPEGQKKIAELVKGIHIAMMVTVAPDGSMDARPMAVQDTPFEGSLWFLTRASSEKVTELEGDRHITLTFSDPGNSKYITLKGRGTVTRDRARVHELWNAMYKAWFPQGEDDPDIAVLRVDVLEGDFWEASGSKVLFYAKYLAAAATGGSVSVGTSGHVTV